MTELIIKVDDDFLEQAKLKGMEWEYELVRCKDCYHYSHTKNVCGLNDITYEPDDYCSRGEKKGRKNETD